MLPGFGFGGRRLNFDGRGRLYAWSISDIIFWYGGITLSTLFDDVRLKTFPKIIRALIFVRWLCSRGVSQLLWVQLRRPGYHPYWKVWRDACRALMK